jgi:Tfp pilus assembly protein PilO
MPRTLLTILFVCLAAAGAVQAQGFKFSNSDQSAKVQEAETQARVQAMLATPCRDKIKNQKILVLIGENINGTVQASQATFSPHFDAINQRLQALGLKTATQAEIRQQVAQAEIAAVFRNDPDAAISASRRLAAQYSLRGLITAQASRNLVVNVNQVNISMAFTLTGANGRMISQASAENASYAGQDVAGMALTLINERADELVAKLYSDYCQNAGIR